MATPLRLACSWENGAEERVVGMSESLLSGSNSVLASFRLDVGTRPPFQVVVVLFGLCRFRLRFHSSGMAECIVSSHSLRWQRVLCQRL